MWSQNFDSGTQVPFLAPPKQPKIDQFLNTQPIPTLPLAIETPTWHIGNLCHVLVIFGIFQKRENIFISMCMIFKTSAAVTLGSADDIGWGGDILPTFFEDSGKFSPHKNTIGRGGKYLKNLISPKNVEAIMKNGKSMRSSHHPGRWRLIWDYWPDRLRTHKMSNHDKILFKHI